jgi:hypothetical protein
MITCKEFPDREFSTKEELFKALADNKAHLVNLKKSAIKNSDSFSFGYVESVTDKEEVVKANNPVLDPNINELKVKVVMNTTNLLDSHLDVHIKDIWKRTLSHQDRKLHLQEHKRDFDKVITNDSYAYTKTVSWKSLGMPYDGSTQALIFESDVKASRNPLMFEQYKNGWVTNHSVGMGYVELYMCINSEENWAKEYKENWDKYYNSIVNKEVADATGYFWAVTEAKLVEGSAVLFGSNWATPTLDNNMKSAEAPSEEADSSIDTQKQEFERFINASNFLKV